MPTRPTIPTVSFIPAVRWCPPLWRWQSRKTASGDALLRAVILGYDIGFRFHQAFEPRSTTFGATFGCATAAGTLAALDAMQMRYLISYAAQQASGSRAWVGDDDHIEKAFDYAAMPARNGVTAALLIKSGFTGNRDVLEGDQGIIKTYAPCDPAKILAELGQRFTITSCLIKKYPVGSPMMETVDATLAMLAKQSVNADEISKVVVRIPESGARTVNNRHMPDVNVQFMVAAILIEGKLTFDMAHDYARFQNPRVLALKDKVQLIGDNEMEKSGHRFQGLVEVTLRDGRDGARACDRLPRPSGESYEPRRSRKESGMVDGAGAGEKECRSDYRFCPPHRVDKQRSRSHQATGGSLTAIDHCRILRWVV